MSTISNALNNWLQRYYSVMRQEMAVCELLPEQTRAAMIEISSKSALKGREMGAAITQDYTLGTVFTGTKETVPIPRPEGTRGTFHTHPHGSPFPSPSDILEILYRKDSVSCIGASGYAGTKIQCFTPKEPRWSAIRDRLVILADDIKEYNKKVGDKYKLKGANLRRLLESIGSKEYVEEARYITLEELEKSAIGAEQITKNREESARVADMRAKEAAEESRVASAKITGLTGDARKEAEIEARTKEIRAKRFAAQVKIEHELARDARVAADELTFKVKALRLGRMQPVTENKEAIEHLREGVDLVRRRGSLEDEVKALRRHLAVPEEWMAQKWVDGFKEVSYAEAHPTIFDKCRIIWETFEEELPYEL